MDFAVQEHIPLLGEPQTDSRSLADSEPSDGNSAGYPQDTSSAVNTQQSRITPPSSLPLPKSAPEAEGQVLSDAPLIKTPESVEVDIVRERSHSKSPLGTSKEAVIGQSQGQAALEQAGKLKGALQTTRHRHSERRTEEREQARKGFAHATLCRFKVKLEGLKEREGSPQEGVKVVVMSVEEQVEKVLQQASSMDNLARMYEGWTPWI